MRVVSRFFQVFLCSGFWSTSSFGIPMFFGTVPSGMIQHMHCLHTLGCSAELSFTADKDMSWSCPPASRAGFPPH
jgi:hypothetical protein